MTGRDGNPHGIPHDPHVTAAAGANSRQANQAESSYKDHQDRVDSVTDLPTNLVTSPSRSPDLAIILTSLPSLDLLRPWNVTLSAVRMAARGTSRYMHAGLVAVIVAILLMAGMRDPEELHRGGEERAQT